LAEALRAGETPSPEMVAAAGEEELPSLGKAWGIFGLALLAAAAAIYFLAGLGGLNQVPMTRSPDALREQAREIAGVLEKAELRFDVKSGPTGSLFGSVTPTDIADQLWEKHKVRVDRRKIGGEALKRIGRYQVPIELFQDVTVEVRTLVVPEGGELPLEEELEALAGAEEAPAAEQEKHELTLDELDAAAAAQDAQLIAAGELQPSRADVEGELQADEFDRAVDAGIPEEQG